MTKPDHLAYLANRALVIKILAAATTYGFSVLLARSMHVVDFGKVVFFLNTAFFMSVIGARGQQLSVLKYMPKLVENSDPTALRRFIEFVCKISGTATLAVFLVALILAFVGRFFGFVAAFSYLQFLIGLTLIPLVGLIDIQSHMARAARWLLLSLAPKEILWRAASAVVVITYLVTNNLEKVPPEFVLAALALTLAIIALAQFAILRRALCLVKNHPAGCPVHVADWQSDSNSFWVSSVSNIFLANADILVVTLLLGPKIAGLYFAANRIAMLLSFFLMSYNIVLAPLLAQATLANGYASIQPIVSSATRKSTLPTVALGALIFVFAQPVLSLFGPEFIQAAAPMRVLLVAGIVNAASGPADIALNMCGFHKQAMRASTLSLLASAVLLVLGALWSGATGGALAVLLGTIIRKFMFWRLALVHMSLRTDVFATRVGLHHFKPALKNGL